MIKVYIMRHGETNWNKEGRFQGQKDIPLNDYGRHLARETFKGMDNIEFDKIYSSPLIRAVETAKIVGGGREVFPDKRLIEIGFGSLEGKRKKDDRKTFELFFLEPENYHPTTGGETFNEVKNRLTSFFFDTLLTKENDGKTFLISTHGASMAVVINLIFKGKPINKVWNKRAAKNCGVYAFEYEDGDIRFFLENHIYYNEKNNE